MNILRKGESLMKKFVLYILTIAMIVSIAGTCFACSSENETTGTPTATLTATSTATPTTIPSVNGSRVRVATTTSLYDTGLWTYLKPMFEEQYNMALDVTSQGSGAAINLSKTGDVDVLAVHSKADELKFVADGYGVERIPFAYNYFVIVGPASDPAGISGMNASSAFKQIATYGTTEFVSRGDNSGTHSKEKALWKLAGLNYSEIQAASWYVSAGKGMGDTLFMASEKGAYTLSDKGTFLSYADDLDLEIIVENSSDLLNVYSIIAVNQSRFSWINIAGANNLIEFMTSNETQQLIADYGIDTYGQSLFTPCFGNEPTQ
jgi:tungstate transport system substrate-binding protein